MGLRVDIYRSQYDSRLNFFHGYKSITVINVDGPFEPTPHSPAAKLSHNAFGNPIIVPVERVPLGIGMFGGTYAASSDSRFAEATKLYGAVAIHDRFETPDPRLDRIRANAECGALVLDHGFSTGYGCTLNAGHSGSHER